MSEVDVNQAREHLIELLQSVAKGEEVVLTVSGEPAAKLVRVEPAKQKRELGLDAGTFEVPEDFDDPLPEFEQYR